ncbi:MAG: aspartate aminotransferase family protein [Chlamydiae bacterium]|nr:aspartate aminotransferase family protein [Chlamydiota bacterium]MBI3277670.1 aspartate aminotransferase family protein [Chlamydiota bacterium]
MPTYRKNPVVFVKGKGSYLWDIEGNKYLDCFPGWGVSGLGHCHPSLVKAVREQAGRLMHIANNYYNEVQGDLAKEISKNSFDGKCFFSNSGAEANEGAMKLARKYGHEKGKFKIISTLGSFHGRTLAAVTATGQPKYQQGFDPLVPGFIHVPFNDVEALRKAFDGEIIAVLLEPIQGEGGVHIATPEFLKEARRLCTERDALLILDEVQTGMGRTGKIFAYQHFGIEPDIMTLAKTLGGGIAIGAMIAQKRIGDVLQPATHATTFGGNPLACKAALAVFEILRKEKLAQRSAKMGKLLKKSFESLKKEFDFIKEVRGMGLMMAMELSIDGVELVKRCLEERLVINCTQGNVIRFMPAMTITEKELLQAIDIVRKVFRKGKASV